MRIRAALAVLALFLVSQAALAHASLQKAVPAQRATLFASPERVELLFNERLEPAFCSVSVTDSANKGADQGDVHVAPDNPKLLTVSLKPLPPGSYTVKFRVLSVDGHVVTSQYSFTVRGSR